jgi:Mrp family chromosome partitioning ATPase
MGRGIVEDALIIAPSMPYTICVLTSPDDANPIAANIDILDPILQQLRSQFDLIIVDALATNNSILGVALARKVDGVILVIEAGRVRLPSLVAARNLIEVNAGKLLGAVLNKRRFYIPKYIYRRL